MSVLVASSGATKGRGKGRSDDSETTKSDDSATPLLDGSKMVAGNKKKGDQPGSLRNADATVKVGGGASLTARANRGSTAVNKTPSRVHDPVLRPAGKEQNVPKATKDKVSGWLGSVQGKEQQKTKPKRASPKLVDEPKKTGENRSKNNKSAGGKQKPSAREVHFSSIDDEMTVSEGMSEVSFVNKDAQKSVESKPQKPQKPSKSAIVTENRFSPLINYGVSPVPEGVIDYQNFPHVCNAQCYAIAHLRQFRDYCDRHPNSNNIVRWMPIDMENAIYRFEHELDAEDAKATDALVKQAIKDPLCSNPNEARLLGNCKFHCPNTKKVCGRAVYHFAGEEESVSWKRHWDSALCLAYCKNPITNPSKHDQQKQLQTSAVSALNSGVGASLFPTVGNKVTTSSDPKGAFFNSTPSVSAKAEPPVGGKQESPYTKYEGITFQNMYWPWTREVPPFHWWKVLLISFLIYIFIINFLEQISKVVRMRQVVIMYAAFWSLWLIVAYVGLYLWYWRTWKPRPIPHFITPRGKFVIDSETESKTFFDSRLLPAAPLHMVVVKVFTNPIRMTNKNAMMRYVNEVYASETGSNLGKYIRKEDMTNHIHGDYAIYGPVFCANLTYNMTWYSDAEHDIERSLTHLNSMAGERK